jgi:hypothetical protein
MAEIYEILGRPEEAERLINSEHLEANLAPDSQRRTPLNASKPSRSCFGPSLRPLLFAAFPSTPKERSSSLRCGAIGFRLDLGHALLVLMLRFDLLGLRLFERGIRTWVRLIVSHDTGSFG